ncbi:hypothetical protein M408DRAFT_327674 [Serendipita vermifera MAFF 305830]|uniref:Uncharacterized protein n=1 Tax=Serendipita vermifera MAFF 305830 TaxID=933852 RepID=A0A0C3B3S0_SERVB|nr:hypothetical protein M408DRAFT_327674 [Serendipita vermifera MAFF 305830]
MCSLWLLRLCQPDLPGLQRHTPLEAPEIGIGKDRVLLLFSEIITPLEKLRRGARSPTSLSSR